MTNSAGESLDDILARTRYLLLDFDGPVCDIFAGHPAPGIAEQLRKLITGQAISVPTDVASSSDPLEIFRYAGAISPQLSAKVEAEMASQELTAIATARPTPYVHEVVTSCRNTGRTIAVVSNNSENAVRAYLARHGLDDRVAYVAARTSTDPGQLKPSPSLIEQAINRLDAPPGECAFVGDTTTDVDASASAGIASIGYANKPGKHAALATAGATAVIDSLADLVLPLRARPLPN